MTEDDHVSRSVYCTAKMSASGHGRYRQPADGDDSSTSSCGRNRQQAPYCQKGHLLTSQVIRLLAARSPKPGMLENGHSIVQPCGGQFDG